MQWSTRKPWPFIAIWVILLGLSFYCIPHLDEVTKAPKMAWRSESGQAAALVAREFPEMSAEQLYVVFTSKAGQVDSAAYKSAAQSALRRVRLVPGVLGVTSYWDGKSRIGTQSTASHDGRSAIAIIDSDCSDHYIMRTKLLPGVRKALTSLPKGMQAHVTGELPIFSDMETESDESLARSERIVVPVVLVVLVLLFGSVVAALIPLALGILSVVVATGLYYFWALFFPVDDIAKSVISMFGMGVGVDYSLFLVTRFREELARGVATEEAVRRTMATSGKSIVVSGAAVVISLASLFVVRSYFFSSMAVASILVVVVSVAAIVTLLPLALRRLGPKVFALKIPLFGGVGSERQGRFWHRWAWAVMGRPGVFAALALIPLVALAVPIGRMKTGEPNLSVLSHQADSRIGADILRTDFGIGSTQPIEIVIEVKRGTVADAANLPWLYHLAKELKGQPEVSAVMSHVSLQAGWKLARYKSMYIDSPAQLAQMAVMLSGGKLGNVADVVSAFSRGDLGLRMVAAGGGQEVKDGLHQLVNVDRASNVARFIILPHKSGDSPEVIDFIGRLRHTILPKYTLGRATATVGGNPAEFVDFTAQIVDALPRVISIVLALTFVILVVVLRSFLLPLKAIIMNILSVSAAYGALVLIFQEGHLASVLGVQSLGYVTPISILLLFCSLFGLSMDYEVFLLSRVKEAHDAGHSNEESLAMGLERTAGIITGAAAIMILVFGAFVLHGIVVVQEIGFGLAFSIFLDATLIRIMLVPAFMRLMGEWNWWLPQRVSRALPKYDMSH